MGTACGCLPCLTASVIGLGGSCRLPPFSKGGIETFFRLPVNLMFVIKVESSSKNCFLEVTVVGEILGGCFRGRLDIY